MHRLIAVSEDLRQQLRREILMDSASISVIPNGIDVAEVARLGSEPIAHPWFAAGQPSVVLGVGRLAPQKNFDLLLRAFAAAKAHSPMRLMILGQGPEQEKLEELARKLGVRDDFALGGYVDNPMPYLRQASLFALPSQWEGLSNALLEALACGTPVVASRCPGSGEVLADGRYGTLVNVGDLPGFTEAILGALKRPRKPEQLVRRAEHYGLARMLGSYVAVLQEELTRAAS
jgi:glycosyltransferase involved in cell wall biosynthesis